MTKKQITLSVILGAILLITVVTITYAFFTASIGGNQVAVNVTTKKLSNLTITTMESPTNNVYPGWVGYQAIEVSAASGGGSAVYDLVLNISGDTAIQDDVYVEVCKIEDTQTALAQNQITYTPATLQVNTNANPVQYYMSGGNVTFPNGCTTIVNEKAQYFWGKKIISSLGGKELESGKLDKYYIKLTYKNNTYGDYQNSQQGQHFTITPSISTKAKVVDFNTLGSGLHDNYTGEQIYTWQELLDNNYLKVTNGTLNYGNAGDSIHDLDGVLVLDDSITSIGLLALSGFYKLTSIIIPDSVTSMDMHIFDEDHNLTTITIPSSVTSIGDGTFWACRGLNSVTLPLGITSIGDEAFNDCTSLSIVNYTGSSTDWANITIGRYNDPLANATINYNYTGN